MADITDSPFEGINVADIVSGGKPSLKNIYESVAHGEPDHAAKVIRLSSQTQQPSSFIDENEKETEKAAAKPSDSLFEDIEKHHPIATKFLSDPKNMAVSHDDIQNIVAHESLVKQTSKALNYIKTQAQLGPLYEERAFTHAGMVPGNIAGTDIISSAFRTGPYAAALMGIGSSDPTTRLEQLTAKINSLESGLPKDVGWKTKAIGGLAGFAPLVAGGIGYGTAYGAAGSVIPGVGNVMGAAVGELTYNLQYGIGAVHERLSALRDNEGKPLSPEQVNTFSILGGVLAAGGGRAAIGAATRMLPKAVIDKLVAEGGSKVLSDPKTFRVATGNFLAQGLKNTAAGALGMTEFSASTLAAAEVAKKTSGQPFAYNLKGDVAETWQTFKDASAMFGMGAMLGAPFNPEWAQARRVQAEQNFYREIGKASQDSKLRARLPEEHKRLLGDLVGDSPIEHAHIPVDAFDKYFQGQNIDPARAAEEMGAAKAYSEAKNTGESVKIPFDTYVDKMVGSKHYDGLAGDVKFDPEGMTANQLKERDEAIRGKVAEEQEKSAAEIAKNAKAKAAHDFIFEDVKKQLTDAGYQEGAKGQAKMIDTNAKMAAAHYITEAIRRGVDPEQLYKNEAPRIIGSETAAGTGTAPAERMEQEAATSGKPSVPVEGEAAKQAPEAGSLVSQRRISLPTSVTEHPVFVKAQEAARPVLEAEARLRGADPADHNFALDLYMEVGNEQHELANDIMRKMFKITPEEREVMGARLNILGEKLLAINRLAHIIFQPNPEDATSYYDKKDKGIKYEGAGLLDPLLEAKRALNAKVLKETGERDILRKQAYERAAEAQRAGPRGQAGKEGAPAQIRAQSEAKRQRLPGLPASAEPNLKVLQGAKFYAEDSGLPFRRPKEYAKVDPARAEKIAKAYDELKHDPSDPKVKAAYGALIKETLAQYQTVKEMGIKIEPILPGMKNPYPEGPKQVHADVRNGHLWFFPTEQGFGTLSTETKHPLLAMTKEKLGDMQLAANDVFRIVHDIFGHTKEGNGFGPVGEENAWQSHMRMYSPEAAKAMTTETRGQNSWVNYGPFGEKNRSDPENTTYADQKAGLLPDWVMKEGLVPDAQKEDVFEQAPANVPTFYSKLQKDIEARLPDKATAEQVRALLRDAKEDERKWSGIEDYLQGKDKINKAELLDFLKANQLEVKDVLRGKQLEKTPEGEAPAPESGKQIIDQNDFDDMVSDRVNEAIDSQLEDFNGGHYVKEIEEEIPLDPGEMTDAELKAAGAPELANRPKKKITVAVARDEKKTRIKGFATDVDGIAITPTSTPGGFEKNRFTVTHIESGLSVPHAQGLILEEAWRVVDELKKTGLDFTVSGKEIVRKAKEYQGPLRAALDKGQESYRKELKPIPAQKRFAIFHEGDARNPTTHDRYITEDEAQDKADKYNDDERDEAFNDARRDFDTSDIENDLRGQYIVEGSEEENEGRGTKFGQYTLPGGENYRELLLTLPEKTAGQEIAPLTELPPQYKVSEREASLRRPDNLWQVGEGAGQAFATGNSREEVIAKALDILNRDRNSSYTKKERGGNFQSSHFDEPNILAHVRFKDRTDAEGKKVLFIEEIQSDWHQKGRKEGYARELTSDEKNKISEAEADLARLRELATEAPTDEAAYERYHAAKESLEDMRSAGKGNIPDAPFKKSWHEFTLKRIIRIAAENGYDKIAWTTGEQQAERYSLSKQVDKIAYNPETKNFTAYRGGNKVIDTTAEPSGLSDMIGGEASAKLLAQPKGEGRGAMADDFAIDESDDQYHVKKMDENWSVDVGKGTVGSSTEAKEYALRMYLKDTRTESGGSHVLEGMELKLGGEGMKGFYDKIVPSFLNKFGKKWGAEVKDTTVYGGSAAEEKAGRSLNAHGMELTEGLKNAALKEGFPLFQGGDSSRGFFDAQQKTIALLKNADPSTFMHESAHAWLTSSFEFVKSGEATEDYLKHWDAAKDWLKITDDQEKLTREQQEKFATGFEAYLREGNAPSEALQGIFARFRKWLTQVYRNVAPGEVNDQMRGFMGRLLATDDEIAQAGRETGYRPSEIAELPDADPVSQNRVRTLQERARQQAEDALLKDQMAQFSRENQEIAAGERESLTSRMSPEVAQLPLYRAIEAIEENRPGQRKTAATLANEFMADKLSAQEKAYFETAAELHGFSDGQDLAETIKADAESGGMAATVQRRVEAAMPSSDPAALRAKALEAVHTGQQGELLALEQQILQELSHKQEIGQEVTRRRRIEARVAAEAAKNQARELLESKSLQDAGAFRAYYTAERNAAVRVSKAIAAGDYEKAAEAKGQQMLNHALATEAIRNKAEITRTLKNLKKFSERGGDMLDMPYGFVSQIDDLLAQRGMRDPRDDAQQSNLFKIAQKMSEAGADPSDIANATGLIQGSDLNWQRENLREFTARVNENYRGMQLPDSILNYGEGPLQQRRPNLTLADLRDLNEAVKTINTVGRTFEKYLSAFIKGDLRTNAKELRDKIEANIGKPYGNIPALGEIEMSKIATAVDKIKSIPDGMISTKVNLLTLCEYLDRLDPDGPAKNNIYRPLEHSWNDEQKLRASKAAELDAIRERHYSKADMAKWGERLDSWEIDTDKGPKTVRLTRENAIIMLLNRGSESNLDRLVRGFGVDEARIKAITDKLDKKDHDFAQEVWDYVDSFWPQASALEMDVKGIEPQKVKARAVESVHGSYKGGYFPLAYDFNKSADAYKNELSRNALYKNFTTTAAHTEQGFLQSRVTSLARPVRLDFSGLYNHLDDVIHDITHRKAVIDVSRFLNQSDTKAGIINAIGHDGYRKIEEDLRHIGSSQSEFLTPAEKTVRWFRFGTTFATLGYRAVIFPRRLVEDVANSFREVPFRNMIGSVADTVINPTETREFVRSKSELMSNRAINRERDLMDLHKQWSGKESMLHHFAFLQDTIADQAMSYPVWNAIYKANLEQRGEQRAVEMADESIVKTFGSGRELDKPGAQRGGELNKMVSMYYSWHSMMFNRAWLQGKIAGLEYKEGNVGKALAILASATATTWIIPAANEILWHEIFHNAPEGQEDEEKKKKHRIAKFLEVPFAYFPMARNVAAYGIPELLGEKGRNYRLSPLEDAAENVIKTIAHGANIAGTKAGLLDGKEFDQRFMEDAARSAAVLVGYPQALNTLTFNFIDWLNNEGEANWRDLVSRRTKK